MSAPVALDIGSLRARLERRFRVYDVQADEHVVAFYIDAVPDTLEREFSELKGELKLEGLIPLLKYQGGEHAIYVLRSPTRTRRGWLTNAVLFALTLVTTTMAGAYASFSYYSRDFDLAGSTPSEYTLAVLGPASLLLGFVTFALPLLTILTVHEFGHFVLARRHGIEASLPYFIPVPPVFFGPLIGTFGAFISIRDPMPNRKALFDVGAAGPIAGFVVAVPMILIGLALMAADPIVVEPGADGAITIGTPLLYQAFAYLFQVEDSWLMHPTAFAGWVGLFVTAINLLPAGQLDGGHVAAAMFGEKAKFASYAAVLLLLGMGLAPLFGYPGYDGWLFFALLIGFLGIRHPPTLDGVSGIDAKRRVIGWLTYGMGALCFTLVPFGG